MKSESSSSTLGRIPGQMAFPRTCGFSVFLMPEAGLLPIENGRARPSGRFTFAQFNSPGARIDWVIRLSHKSRSL